MTRWLTPAMRRRQAAVQGGKCSRCGALAGLPCVSATGRTLWDYVHATRLRAYDGQHEQAARRAGANR